MNFDLDFGSCLQFLLLGLIVCWLEAGAEVQVAAGLKVKVEFDYEWLLVGLVEVVVVIPVVVVVVVVAVVSVVDAVVA